MKTAQFRIQVLAMVWSLVSLTSVSHGQSLDNVEISRLSDRVSPAQRFAFSQHLLTGATRGMDVEKDAEAITKIAESWTRWVCASSKSGNSDEWKDFVVLANSTAHSRNDFPLIDLSDKAPRLTAFTLPIDRENAGKLEETYAALKNNEKNDEAWAAMQVEFTTIYASPKSPGAELDLSRRFQVMHLNPSPQAWNNLLYSGSELHLVSRAFESPVQKFQFDRGIQRALVSIGFEPESDKRLANELGRLYVSATIVQKKSIWKDFSVFLAGFMATKKLETIVTFQIQANTLQSGNPTIAFHPVAAQNVNRTAQPSVKLISGKYKMWAERNNKETSSKTDHDVFSETYTAYINEVENVTP